MTGAQNAELLTVRQAAAMLAIGERTLWRWSRSGQMPAPLKLGGSCVRFHRQELLDWIAAGCPKMGGEGVMQPSLPKKPRQEKHHE